MPLVRLEKRDLPQLIENIERQGGDASELRAILEDKTPRSEKDKLSEDEFVQSKIEQSTVEEGENLMCAVCGDKSSTLISGVCNCCFRAWALATKGE